MAQSPKKARRPKNGRPMKRITVSVPESNYVRLEDIAAQEQGSVSQVIRRAIDIYVKAEPTDVQPRLALRRGQ